MPDWITLVIRFTVSSPWIYSCQKCCSGWDENLCRWLVEENLSSANQNIFPLGKAKLPSCSVLLNLSPLSWHWRHTAKRCCRRWGPAWASQASQRASLAVRGNLVLLVIQTSRNSRFPKRDQSQVRASGNEPPPAHSVGSTSSSLPARK